MHSLQNLPFRTSSVSFINLVIRSNGSESAIQMKIDDRLIEWKMKTLF